MARYGLILAAAVALATAAGIENIPTDSRLYDDLDLLKTAGLIRSMPPTSRPWTRAEAVRLVVEADSLSRLCGPGAAQRTALDRLLTEFSDELPYRPRVTGARRPVASIAVPDMPGSFARGEVFSRARADRDTQAVSIGVVINNRPGDQFVFYERAELTGWHPDIVQESIPQDSSGHHIPRTRILPWRNVATLENELAYLAFKVPWLRIEFGRDEFVWGPGHTSSVMLSDNAPALDHLQLCASYRNFKFLSFTSLLSRWGVKPRWLAAQRIELSLWDRLTLGGALMSVTSWDEVQPRALGGLVNPLIPIYITSATTGHGDNFLIGWDAVVYLPRTKVYGQLFLDNYEFNTDSVAPNAVGLQGGAYWAPNLPLDLRVEYARVTAYTYYHRVPTIMYENYLTTMGHEIGPDADQIVASARVTTGPWLRLSLTGDYTRRGFFNRGDYNRRSFHLADTLILRRENEFPVLGLDQNGKPLAEDWQVDNTWRVGPEVEVNVGRDLKLVADALYRSSTNYLGIPDAKDSGLDLDLKVEYRY